MIILVTGGSGTIGSNLKEVINNEKTNTWLFPTSKELNLLNLNDIEKYFIENKPEFIIHLAANVGGLYKNHKYKVEMFRENIFMNENILYVANKLNIKKGIFCCSTCIFPSNPPFYPMTEDMIMYGEPHVSNDSYGWAKRLLYFQCKNYNKQNGCKYICITPCNIYGKYDNFNLENSHVVAGLIHKFYNASKNKNSLEIKTGLNSMRQFISAADICNILLLMINNFNNIDYDNIILSDDDILIIDLIKIISNNFKNVEYKIINDEQGQIKKTCSNKLMKDKFTNFILSDFEGEINKIIEWFKENYDNNVRK